MSSETISPTILVTGATGLIGRCLCDHFARLGWRVRGLVRNLSVYPFQEPGIRIYRGDLPSHIDQTAFDNIEIVVHCAYMTRFTNIEEARRINEEGTGRILDLSRKVGAKRFIFVSSTAAHQEARSYYGQSKHKLEGIFDMRRDLVLRPGLVLSRDGGLLQRLERLMSRLPLVPLLTDGDQVIQTVHVEDLCKAFEQAISGGVNGIVTVAEPEGLKFREFLQLLAARIQPNCRIMQVPYQPILAALRMAESIGISLPISSENLLGLLGMRHISSEADLERLGLKVRTTNESLAHLFPSVTSCNS